MQNDFALIFTYIALAAGGYFFASYYMESKRNRFPVVGRTVLITGGSQGLGVAVGKLLASKGANVIVVARNETRLKATVEAMRQAAHNAQIQRFTHIVADLTDADAATDMMAQATAWNHGRAPEIVWCCAGTAMPTLFIDTEPSVLKEQMDANYFTSAFTAHAALRAWIQGDAAAASSLKTTEQEKGATNKKNEAKMSEEERLQKKRDQRPRHLIFTSSVLALFGVCGYAPYAATKNALRGLADTLAMEVRLYAGAHPEAAPVSVHQIIPATIFSEGFEHEQQIKTDLCKELEKMDEKGQTPMHAAQKAVQGLERGREYVPTALLPRAMTASVLSGARNVSVLDRLLALVVAGGGVMAFIRRDLDKRTFEWGRKHGISGKKTAE